ncbi:unnamed protein product, partial [Ixodes hexagonus]
MMDLIYVLLGAVLTTTTLSFAYPSPVYGRLQRNAVQYPPQSQYPYLDTSNYYAALKNAAFGQPDWAQYLQAPAGWTGSDAYTDIRVPQGTQDEDYPEYDSTSADLGAANPFGYDWYGPPNQPQELKEAAVFKDLLANYITKKSEGVPEANLRRTETMRKYGQQTMLSSPLPTTVRPSAAAVAAKQAADMTSTPVPNQATPAAKKEEGSEGQKEFAMFRPVGTNENRRPSFWSTDLRQTTNGQRVAVSSLLL